MQRVPWRSLETRYVSHSDDLFFAVWWASPLRKPLAIFDQAATIGVAVD